MNLANTLDFVAAAVGFILTLMVFSYILGDNLLFRIATYTFIGVTAGYATALVLVNIVWQRIVLSLIRNPGESFAIVAPGFLLGIWLLLKVSPRLSRLGSMPMAFLVGVGAATVLAGAVLGTLFPQANATMNAMNLSTVDNSQLSSDPVFLVGWLINGLIVLVGSLATLAYFQFGSQNSKSRFAGLQDWINGLRLVGKGFIAVSLGVLFAGVYAASAAAFVERAVFSWNLLWKLIGAFFPNF